MSGKLIGVGVGPGDPELLTLKAVRLIQNAPVLAYTVDAGGRSYARQTVEQFTRAGQVELPLLFSMSTLRTERLKTRQDAAESILRVLQAGVDVVFITEGDPLLYSTFQHLLSEMPPEVSVEICPGISAVFSAAGAACFPLAVEGQMLVIAPAEAALGRLGEWLDQGYRIVLFKVSRWLNAVQKEIIASNLRCETALVERASTDGEVITRRVEDWAGREAPYFSIVLLRPLEKQETAE